MLNIYLMNKIQLYIVLTLFALLITPNILHAEVSIDEAFDLCDEAYEVYENGGQEYLDMIESDNYVHVYTFEANKTVDGKSDTTSTQKHLFGLGWLLASIPSVGDPADPVLAKAICVRMNYSDATEVEWVFNGTMKDPESGEFVNTVNINVSQEIIDADIPIIIDMSGEDEDQHLSIKFNNIIPEDLCALKFSGANIGVKSVTVEGTSATGICTTEESSNISFYKVFSNFNAVNGFNIAGLNILTANSGAKGNGEDGINIADEASDVVIEDSEISYNEDDGVDVNGSNVEINNSNIYNNQSSDVHVGSSAENVAINDSNVMRITDESEGQLSKTNVTAKCSDGYRISDDEKYCILSCSEDQVVLYGECVDVCPSDMIQNEYGICFSSTKGIDSDLGVEIDSDEDDGGDCSLITN
ncbi:right-handed parallel beta-helix repeat-containing protein, partial [bacterium]|nr:right-handed parallel beta-helix repeat-containing protein [bacterium]